ncbi:hypothetical protein [Kingella oralis]
MLCLFTRIQIGQTKGSLKTGERRFQAAFNDGHYAKSAYSAVER